MGVADKVQEAGRILGALGVIGFIGIAWLMIYGNLSGNLGFSQDTTYYENQSITLVDGDGVTPAGASGLTNGLISGVVMTNSSNSTELGYIDSGNYSVSGVYIIATESGAAEYNNTVVNVTYTVAYDTQHSIRTEGVIDNTSEGFATFFGFSVTLFRIAAIVLLIFMLFGLLSVVIGIAKTGKEKRGFSSQ